MLKKIIKSSRVPLPIGPYNQAVVINNLIYTAGQIAIDSKSGVVIDGGITEQTKLVLDYVKAILKEAGSSLKNVVKATVFLKNMNDFQAMNAVYSQYFEAATAPARSTIEVARLPKDVLVEIEVVASL